MCMNIYLQDMAFIEFQTSMHTLGQLLCQRRQRSGFVQHDVGAAVKSFLSLMTVQLTHVSLTVQFDCIAACACNAVGHDYTAHTEALQCTCHILLAADSSFTHFIYIILFHFIPYSPGFGVSCGSSLKLASVGHSTTACLSMANSRTPCHV